MSIKLSLSLSLPTSWMEWQAISELNRQQFTKLSVGDKNEKWVYNVDI